MSGAMRKMGVYLGLLEDADGDYAELDNDYDEPARRQPEQTRDDEGPAVDASCQARQRQARDDDGEGPRGHELPGERLAHAQADAHRHEHRGGEHLRGDHHEHCRAEGEEGGHREQGGFAGSGAGGGD